MTKDEERKSNLCLQCMECCKWLAFPICEKNEAEFRRASLAFYRARGLKIFEKNGFVMAGFQHTCQHLTKGGCSIYDTRPIACILYDGTKDPLVKHKCLWPHINKKR